MKKEVKTMTPENFRPYGTYITWEEIDVKNDPVNFYKEDSIVSKLSTDLCALTLQGVSPRENVVTRSEYHAFTEEIYGGFEEDVVMHVGLLCGRGRGWEDLGELNLSIFKKKKNTKKKNKENALWNSGKA